MLLARKIIQCYIRESQRRLFDSDTISLKCALSTSKSRLPGF